MAPPVNLTNFVVSRCCSHASMQCKNRSKLLLQFRPYIQSLDQYRRPSHEVGMTAAVCKQNTIGLHTILHIIIYEARTLLIIAVSVRVQHRHPYNTSLTLLRCRIKILIFFAAPTLKDNFDTASVYKKIILKFLQDKFQIQKLERQKLIAYASLFLLISSSLLD